jgi:type IV pilus assembly protein PilY1
MNKFNQVKAAVVGLVLSTAVIPAAMADDIEIYTTDPAETAGVNPNILFLVDNSISMGTAMTVTAHYDPGTTYTGDCVTDGIYFVPLGQKGPDCTTDPAPGNYFNRSALVCDVAKFVYVADPATGVIEKEQPAVEASLSLFGTYSDQFARYNDTVSNAKKWEKLPAGITATAERDYEVECLSDSGAHGAPGGKLYIQDGNAYTSTVPANLKVPHPVWSNGGGHMTIWDGNYLNYLAEVKAGTVGTINTTRLAEMVRAVDIMVSTNNRVNIGLISLDESSAREGGSIQYPMQDIGEARSNFKKQVLPGLSAEAYTTLSETYYEALLYFGGKKIDYGNNATPTMVGAAKDGGGGNYLSPISSTCGANYIVVLSDGTPTKDDANTKNADDVDRFDLLPGMSKTICNTSPTSAWDDDNQDADDPGNSVVDNCLPELAEWANTHDVATKAIPAHAGEQNITTHSIAFSLDPADAGDEPAINLLTDTATGEDGQFFIAQTGDELVAIFQAVITKALKVNTTFSSPAVSVNAFNRSTHLDDLYFTLFKPHATKNAWSGNLKKYKIKFATDATTKKVTPFIADSTNSPAVDADTGFFGNWSRSYWSTVVDGKLVEEGGAASKMPDPRKVYTITGDMTDDDANGVFVTAVSDLTNAVNEVADTNELTDALLGIGGLASILNDAAGDPIPYRNTLINWAAGMDVFSRYGALDTSDDARLNMGDPLHAEPALVQYGQTADGDPVLTAFVATNDGYLHAIDADTGIEKFSFIPQELLTQLPRVMENNGGEKSYGLDGSVVAWIKDDAKDGIDAGATGADPAAGDHVYLYFGMRRGGRNIYALNVTDPDSPALMWVIKGGQGDYANLGETWSTVNVRKVKDGATEKTVLVFGGGYDATQDNASVRTVDGVGNTVYIADAATGAKLWSASHADMDYSIPARVLPVDVSSDGFIDRLYAADMGGQVFRFDINNNNGSALSASITGGRVADLAGDDEANARRFYYPPDVALIDAPDGAYHALVLSSGFRAHPLNKTIHDRIYMIKDRNTGLLTSNDAYRYDPAVTGAAGSLTEANLYNATVNLAGGE